MIKSKEEVLFSVVHKLYFIDSDTNLNIKTINDLYIEIIDSSDRKGQNNIMFVLCNSLFRGTEIINYDELFFLIPRLTIDGINVSIVTKGIDPFYIVSVINLKSRSILLHLTGEEFLKWTRQYSKSSDYLLSNTDLVYINMLNKIPDELFRYIIKIKKEVDAAFIIDYEDIDPKCISELGNGFIINQGEKLASKIQTY